MSQQGLGHLLHRIQCQQEEKSRHYEVWNGGDWHCLESPTCGKYKKCKKCRGNSFSLYCRLSVLFGSVPTCIRSHPFHCGASAGHGVGETVGNGVSGSSLGPGYLRFVLIGTESREEGADVGTGSVLCTLRVSLVDRRHAYDRGG